MKTDAHTIGTYLMTVLLYVATFGVFCYAGGFWGGVILMALLFLPLMYLFTPFIYLGGFIGGFVGWVFHRLNSRPACDLTR